MSADRPPPSDDPDAGPGSADAGGGAADAEDRPATPFDRVRAWNQQAETMMAAGDPAGALGAAEQAARVVQRPGGRLRPWARERTPDLLGAGSHALHLVTALRSQAGNSPEALRSAEQGLGWARLLRAAGDSPPARLALSVALNDVVDVRLRLGGKPDDLAYEAVAAAEAAVGASHSPSAARLRLADADLNVGSLALRSGDLEPAEARLTAAGATWASIDPPTAGADPALGLTGLRLGRLQADLAAARGDPQAARDACRGLIDQAADLLVVAPDHAGLREEVRLLHLTIHDASRALGDTAEAQAALRGVERPGYRTECPDDRYAECRDGLLRLGFDRHRGQFPEPAAAEVLLKSALDLDRAEGSPRTGGLVAAGYRALAEAHLGWGTADLAWQAAGRGVAQLDARAAPEERSTRAGLLTLRGDAAGALGSPGGALRSYEEALIALGGAPEVATMGLHRRMASAEVTRGHGAAALQHLITARGIALPLADRGDPRGLRELALCQEILAGQEVREGRPGSERTLAGAWSNLEGLPASIGKERDRARLVVLLVAAESRSGRRAPGVKAEARLLAALTWAEELDGAPGRRAAAAALDALGHVKLAEGSLRVGLSFFERARGVRQELRTTLGESPQTLRELARSHRNVGDAHLLLADHALDQLEAAADPLDRATARHRAQRECDAAHRAFQTSRGLLVRQRKGLERRRLDTGEVVGDSALLRERQGDVWLRRAELGSLQLRGEASRSAPPVSSALRPQPAERRPVTGPVGQADAQYVKAAELLVAAGSTEHGALVTMLDKRAYLARMGRDATYRAGLLRESAGFLDHADALSREADELRFRLPEAERPEPWEAPPGRLRPAHDHDMVV